MRSRSLKFRALVVLVMSALLLGTPEPSAAGVPCEHSYWFCVEDWGTTCPSNQASLTECRSTFPNCRISGALCGTGGANCGSAPQLTCFLDGNA